MIYRMLRKLKIKIALKLLKYNEKDMILFDLKELDDSIYFAHSSDKGYNKKVFKDFLKAYTLQYVASKK